jgi:dTDP-4-dehydrorhamnose reductase
MKIFITGSQGQLGKEIVHQALSRGIESFSYSHQDLDITQIDLVRGIIGDLNPDVIINCAAYNNVDGAESESLMAYAVNCEGVRNLAICAKLYGAYLIHYSTDYVFDGKKTSTYLKIDTPNPINIYGESKLEGEKAVQEIFDNFLILRVSWVFGQNPKASFPLKLLSWSKSSSTLKMVSDQTSSPTSVVDIANVTFELLKEKVTGLYHFSNSGFCSRYEWAHFILNRIGWAGKITPVPSSEFPTPAQRPTFSALDNSEVSTLIGKSIPTWQEATIRFIETLKYSS